MRRRQTIFVAIIAVDVESVDAIHTLQLLETVEGHLAGSCHKLQQFSALFLVERSQSSPEPLDLLRRWIIVVVLCVALPVVDVDVRQTGDQELQLLLVEDRDQLCRNDFVETCRD